jgi:hypothetical protein
MNHESPASRRALRRRLATAALGALAWSLAATASAQTKPAAPPPAENDDSNDDVVVPQTPAESAEQAPLEKEPKSPKAPFRPSGSFEFGSYGRVNAAIDGRGGTGRDADIVAHGSRVDDDSYAEIELRREDQLAEDLKTRVVTTLALLPPFFHFSGDAANAIAVRQLYAQATYRDWTLWAGSRMYRGDDIYVLNWWPLDNQNNIGGGVGKSFSGETYVALHAGLQRLDQPYQYQTIPAPIPYGFGATQVTYLDRPRTIETLKVTHFMRDADPSHPGATLPSGFKFVLYGEAHELPAGVRRDTDLNIDRGLPADSGFLAGLQATYFTGLRDSYASVIVRHARGLAAYDPLAAPNTFAIDKTTSGANETLIATGGNFERDFFGVAWGAYLRFFRDASGAPTSLSSYDEGIALVRPQFYVGEHWGIGIEGSYQSRRYAVLDGSSNEPLVASLLRGAVLPYFSPTGRGTFKRPQIGLVYAITSRNAAAKSLYPIEDVFARRGTEHYLGITTEWWFNSSSYP